MRNILSIALALLLPLFTLPPVVSYAQTQGILPAGEACAYSCRSTEEL
jgi:hypothetical protein